MDIPEWMSHTSPIVWKALRFSTVVVCTFGILGNVSSVAVLRRHLSDIPGARLLLTLGIADLGVVTAVTMQILAYVAYGYTTLTKLLEWWFLYCYYCSIYVTVFVSVDRLLQTAKPLLLLKITYRRVQRIVISVIFGTMLIVSLPHLLGSVIKYHYQPHLVTFELCADVKETCDFWTHWAPTENFSYRSDYILAYTCSQGKVGLHLKLNYTNAIRYINVIQAACLHQKETNYTVCYQPISIPSVKFDVSMIINVLGNKYIDVCNSTEDHLRHDPDFVKALYLGVDIPFRYAIPIIALAITNIWLVLAVRRAQNKHADITRTARVSLFNLPILKSVAAIVFVFLICHTAGSAIFIMDIVRALLGLTHMAGRGHSQTNTLLHSNIHMKTLVFKHLGLLLASVNSSINVVIYCCFLPVFRHKWKICWCKIAKEENHQDKLISDLHVPEEAVVPWKEMQVAGHVGSYYKITTCCRTLASTLRVVRDNVWILLRLTCCIVSGVLVLLSSAYTIWKIPTSDSNMSYADLRPVLFRELAVSVWSITVSGKWLVATGIDVVPNDALYTYRLPDVHPVANVSLHSYGGCFSEAGSDGQVFAGCWGRVTVLQISDTGNITVTHNLTAEGRLKGRRNVVALGPRHWQLWVTCWYRSQTDVMVLLVDVDTDTVIEPIIRWSVSDPGDAPLAWVQVASLVTGETLLSDCIYPDCHTVLYQTIAAQPTNISVAGQVKMSHKDHFLLRDIRANTIMIVDGKGKLLHTVDVMNGKHRISTEIVDIALWRTNFVILGFNGKVAMFSTA